MCPPPSLLYASPCQSRCQSHAVLTPRCLPLFPLPQVANCILFMAGMYSSEVVTLLDSLMLALLSMVCVVEISIFSHRFRSVLTTLGAINEVRRRMHTLDRW